MAIKSCLPGMGNSLCNVCGTNVDTENIPFGPKEPNLVYMDKIYSYNQATTCPLMHNLTNSLCTQTSEPTCKECCDDDRGNQRRPFPTRNRFVVELELGGAVSHCNCNSGCSNGCNSGCNNGCNSGCNNGCNSGCSNGCNSGCSNGCNSGCNNGCNSGCNNGCNSGCNNGCNSGCNNGCNSGCNTCTLNSDAVFKIERSYVLVDSLILANPAVITPSKVTVDGIPVDSLTQSGGQFTATTNSMVSQLTKERCVDAGLPSKGFLLINGAGPWLFRGTFVFEGTVNTGGKTCRFVAKFTTRESEPILINGASTFALPKVAFPCVINGTGPVMNFNFGGSVYVLKPEINAFCCGTNCTLSLKASMAVEPKVNVEVIRKSLFCVDACEGMRPCDGTRAAYEIDDEEDACQRKPACKCGTAVECLNENSGCDCNECSQENSTCECNEWAIMSQWNGCNGCSW